jgi:hypothetical protein
MYVNPSQAFAGEMVFMDKSENLFLLGDWCLRKSLQKAQNLHTILNLTAGQLSNHIWMTKDLRFLEEFLEFRQPISEMGHPNGGIR